VIKKQALLLISADRLQTSYFPQIAKWDTVLFAVLVNAGKVILICHLVNWATENSESKNHLMYFEDPGQGPPALYCACGLSQCPTPTHTGGRDCDGATAPAHAQQAGLRTVGLMPARASSHIKPLRELLIRQESG